MFEKIRSFSVLCKESFLLLKRTEPMILSASTAFFTTFALSPILILLVNFFGLYFQSDKVSNQLFGKIAATVGTEAAADLQNIVNNFMEFETSWMLTTAGILFFIFVGTTLLGVIRQNIHMLWRIRKSTKPIRNQVRERLTFLTIIVVTGALFLLSVLIDSSLAISLDYLQSIIPRGGILIIQLLNFILSIIIVTIWFTIIFKMVPHAVVNWDVAFNGAFVTALLFTAGKFALGKILIHARIASIFGASASFALLLLFIFYSSFILYFGAAFTHEYAESTDNHISPGKYAHEYEEKLVGKDE